VTFLSLISRPQTPGVETMGLKVRLIVVAGLTLAMAACGSSGGSGGAKSEPAAKPLAGSDWVLTGMTPAVRALAGVSVSARFADGAISGHSGCNTYHGSYTQRGDRLTIGTVAGTRMACPPAPTAVERGYLERLAKVKSFTRTATTLVLRDASGATLLSYAAPSADAINGSWIVTSLYTGDALVSPTGTLTAKFANSSVSGDAGCNTFSGGVQVDGSNITIGPLASTQRACLEADKTKQESQYLQALGLAKRFEVLGDRLSLFRADGGYAVVFTRAGVA